jgi:hypothetical protein
MTTITWKGYEWEKQNDAVGYDQKDENNISIDSNGYLNLSISNPTGTQPIGSDLISVSKDFGYGTYRMVTEGDFTTFYKNIVLASFWLFKHGSPWIEFDVAEISKWDFYADTKIQGVSWYGDTGSVTSQLERMNIPSDTIQTHIFTWKKNLVNFRSYIGDVNGEHETPYYEKTYTNNIPNYESGVDCRISMWCYKNGNDADDYTVPETTIIIRDFSYISAKEKTAGTKEIRGLSHG